MTRLWRRKSFSSNGSSESSTCLLGEDTGEPCASHCEPEPGLSFPSSSIQLKECTKSGDATATNSISAISSITRSDSCIASLGVACQLQVLHRWVHNSCNQDVSTTSKLSFDRQSDPAVTAGLLALLAKGLRQSGFGVLNLDPTLQQLWDASVVRDFSRAPGFKRDSECHSFRKQKIVHVVLADICFQGWVVLPPNYLHTQIINTCRVCPT